MFSKWTRGVHDEITQIEKETGDKEYSRLRGEVRDLNAYLQKTYSDAYRGVRDWPAKVLLVIDAINNAVESN